MTSRKLRNARLRRAVRRRIESPRMQSAALRQFGSGAGRTSLPGVRSKRRSRHAFFDLADLFAEHGIQPLWGLPPVEDAFDDPFGDPFDERFDAGFGAGNDAAPGRGVNAVKRRAGNLTPAERFALYAQEPNARTLRSKHIPEVASRLHAPDTAFSAPGTGNPWDGSAVRFEAFRVPAQVEEFAPMTLRSAPTEFDLLPHSGLAPLRENTRRRRRRLDDEDEFDRDDDPRPEVDYDPDPDFVPGDWLQTRESPPSSDAVLSSTPVGYRKTLTVQDVPQERFQTTQSPDAPTSEKSTSVPDAFPRDENSGSNSTVGNVAIKRTFGMPAPSMKMRAASASGGSATFRNARTDPELAATEMFSSEEPDRTTRPNRSPLRPNASLASGSSFAYDFATTDSGSGASGVPKLFRSVARLFAETTASTSAARGVDGGSGAPGETSATDERDASLGRLSKLRELPEEARKRSFAGSTSVSPNGTQTAAAFDSYAAPYSASFFQDSPNVRNGTSSESGTRSAAERLVAGDAEAYYSSRLPGVQSSGEGRVGGHDFEDRERAPVSSESAADSSFATIERLLRESRDALLTLARGNYDFTLTPG